MSFHIINYHIILYYSHVGMWVEKATRSSILAWRFPWTEEPGRLQSRRVSNSQKWLTERLSTEIWKLDHRERWALKNWWSQIVVLEKTLENPLNCKVINQSILNQPWIFIERTNAEAEAPVLWPPEAKSWLIEKDPDTGKDCRQKKGSAEDEILRYHHWLNGHEFEQTPEDSEGQRSQACCSPWGYKELDTT